MLGALAAILVACSIGGVPARCGTVLVPENRAAPAQQIALSVAVLPASEPSARRADPLFYIAGGPGGVATDELPAVARAFADANRHRDIVFVDQRGVGGSNPLLCRVAQGMPSLAALVAACLGDTAGDVRHYRTPGAMDDLDAVREALGYRTIDVYGVSYGATAAQVFLQRHPASVRAVVLDGATLLDVPVFERWSSSGQRALKLLDRRCSADRGCASAFPHWYDRFPAFLKRLSRHPLGSGGGAITAAAVADTIDEMTATMTGAAQVPYTIARAETGDVEGLAQAMAARADGDAIQVMPLAIMCTEPWAVRDPARVYADAKGTYLVYSQPAGAVAARQLCDAWPQPDVAGEDWSRVRSAAPVLVLVGGSDPKDPPANVAGVQQAMPNAKVVVVPGGAHGVAGVGCLPHVLDAFLEAGTAQGLDTSCAALTPYPRFRLR